MATPRRPAKKTPANRATARKEPAKKTAAAVKKTTSRRAATKKTATPRKRVPAKKAATRRKDPPHVSETVAEVAEQLTPPVAAPVDDDTYGAVERATRRDLNAWGVGDSGLSEAAYQMAREIDSGENAGARIGAARELRFMVRAAKADKRTRPMPDEPPTDKDGKPVKENDLDKLRRQKQEQEQKRRGETG